MGKFTALVILSQDTNNIQEKVVEMLSPYYFELEVEPHKEYFNQEELQAEMEYLSTFSKEEIKKLADKYEVSGENLIEDLAKINLDWYEEDIAGIDEHGAYQITTINPQGKWDWYIFIKAEPRELESPISYPCRVADLPKIVPYALITPDGKWYEANGQEIDWDLKVQEILAFYPNCLAVGLLCHM
ncbi:MAG: hypothetical protein HC815_21010 [Richelia sp. RM1_1_1]|nr:hypothetical protein [Richelia sp. RM1_1_1]